MLFGVPPAVKAFFRPVVTGVAKPIRRALPVIPRGQIGDAVLLLDHGPHLRLAGNLEFLRLLHPPVAVDHRGNTHFHGTHHGPPRFDGEETADGQMLGVLAGAVEPAVVGNIDEEIHRGRIVRAWGNCASGGAGVETLGN
jgi:hypothetical protein